MIGYHSSVGSGSCGFSAAMSSVESQDDAYKVLSIVLRVAAIVARPEHGPAEGRGLTSFTHDAHISGLNDENISTGPFKSYLS